MSGKNFTRQRLTWLKQVAADPEVPAMAFKLAYILAMEFMNRDTGTAWPSQETLARAVGTSDRTVRTLTSTLQSRGHLDVQSGSGRRDTSNYRMSGRKPGSTLPPFKGKNPEANFHLSEPETRKPASEKGGSPLPREPLERTIGREREDFVLFSDDAGSSFEEWWQTYPRRIAKTAARRAYDRVLKKQEATVGELLAGAERFAAERRGKEQRYTPHPATWLNGHRWSDESEGESLPPAVAAMLRDE